MSPITSNPVGYQKGLTPAVPHKDGGEIFFWPKILLFLRTHQNLIFFILLTFCLAGGLLWWRHYRVQEMTQRAFYEMEKAEKPEALQGLLQVYGVTSAAPLMRYKMANLYMNDEKYEEARKEYEYIIEKFPSHPVKDLAIQRLSQLKVSEFWKQGELERQIAELVQKRNLPRLTIKTNKGDFEVELYEDEAPNTVANFISLVQDDVYTQTAVYKINPDLGVHFGKKELLDYCIPFEDNLLKHQEGVIGMLKDDEDSIEQKEGDKKEHQSSASRFYIHTALLENEELDGKYTIFGKVIKGMATVRELVKGDTINSIKIDFKRQNEYKANKIKVERQSVPPAPITPTAPAPPK